MISPVLRSSALGLAAFVLAGLALAAPAEAHVLSVAVGGFAQGFAHPMLGLDHQLAMLAVGLWAAQMGGRAVWVLPIAFPVVMVLGAILGMAGVALPAVEIGIAVSVLALGAAVAFAVKPSLVAGVAVVSAFALLHGHAHGTELPEAASPVLYGLGFVLATVALHLVGIALGFMLKQPWGARAMRLGGSAIAVAGVVLLVAGA